jgi:cobalt-zinc-cadmium efflux system protein
MSAMAHSHRAALGSGDVAYGLGGDRRQARRALAVVLALTGAFTIVEAIGGILTGSLALLADAGHMLSDDISLAIALGAVWLAERPPTPNRSFGYQRAEILAALFNGVTLVAISIWIFVEAGQRFADPPEIEGGWMLAVAAAGLAVNVGAAAILWERRERSLNLAAAFRHVLADLLGSIAVIVAAAVVLVTGWLYADPVISVAIGVLILASSWSILRDSTRVLLEAAPSDIDAHEVGAAMASSDGIIEVHDLHLWEVTSGFPALSAHILVGADDDCHSRRRELDAMLHTRFGIGHTTLQVEHAQPELLQLGPTPTREERGG